MADSLKAPLAGQRYQALLFWSHAAELLDPSSKVVQVSFEDPEVRAFDDIVVHYDPPIGSPLTEQVSVDHIQAKYHIGAGGAFRLSSMTDPEFVGAKSNSLLQRLGDASRRVGVASFPSRRFWIVSPWAIHPEDRDLCELWEDTTASFRLEVLRRGTRTNSRWVKLRDQWRAALQVDHDDDLCAILSKLRLKHSEGGLNGRLRDFVDMKLRFAGLKGLKERPLDTLYASLPWALFSQGVKDYTKDVLEQVATEYGLHGTVPPRPGPGRRLGIRTAVQWADQMESTADAMLPLEQHFEGRFIRDRLTWSQRYAQVREFLRGQLSHTGPYHLELGALASVAFAAGYAMPEKDGISIYPLQRHRDGITLWDASTPDEAQGGWATSRDEQVGEGVDVALGLSVTQSTWEAMEAYVRAYLPTVGRILELRTASGLGMRSVVNAGHALFLAETGASAIRSVRLGTASVVHLFIAGPNALTFFLGQQGERVGRCQLYEFDFGGERDSSYQPSLLVPDHTR